MKVYRKNKYGEMSDVVHCVLNSEWKQGKYTMLTLFLKLFCGKEVEVRKGDEYRDHYKKDSKRLCPDCKKVLKKRIMQARSGGKSQTPDHE